VACIQRVSQRSENIDNCRSDKIYLKFQKVVITTAYYSLIKGLGEVVICSRYHRKYMRR